MKNCAPPLGQFGDEARVVGNGHETAGGAEGHPAAAADGIAFVVALQNSAASIRIIISVAKAAARSRSKRQNSAQAEP